MEPLNEPNKPMKGYFNSEARRKDNLAEVSDFDKTPVLEEDEIRLQNPWGSILGYVNPIQDDSTLYDDNAQCVLICDKDDIIEHNNQYKGTDYEYQIQKWPKPFMGNPLKADVVLLSLNPGYKEWQKKRLAKAIEKEYRKEIVKHLRLQTNLEAASMFCPDKKDGNLALTYLEAHTLVDNYWYDMIEKFRESAGIPKSNEEIDPLYTRLSVIEYIGYASKRYKDLPKGRILPSQDFTRMLIQYLTMKRKTVFVVVRAENQWNGLIGNELWNKLKRDNRLILSKKKRKQSLTKGFEKEEDYSKMVELLKK